MPIHTVNPGAPFVLPAQNAARTISVQRASGVHPFMPVNVTYTLAGGAPQVVALPRPGFATFPVPAGSVWTISAPYAIDVAPVTTVASLRNFPALGGRAGVRATNVPTSFVAMDQPPHVIAAGNVVSGTDRYVGFNVPPGRPFQVTPGHAGPVDVLY